MGAPENSQPHIHPGRLTWNLQITHLERKMIFQTSMIMFHVSLQGCTPFHSGYFIGYILVKIMRCIRKIHDPLRKITHILLHVFGTMFQLLPLGGILFPRSLEGKSHIFSVIPERENYSNNSCRESHVGKNPATKKWGPENKNPKSCVVWLPNRQEPSVEGSNRLKSHLK